MLPEIAILGAGPAGLLLGRYLELANIPYVIYEREETPLSRDQGGTLDVHAGTGQLALQEAGLIDNFQKLARYDAPSFIADRTGKIVVRCDPEPGTEDRDRPEIDRKTLRELLLNSIPSYRVKWGMKVQQPTKAEDGTIAVQFQDGHVDHGYRLVVGADGAWSKARSMVTSATPQYSGYTYLTAAIKKYSSRYAHVESLAKRGNYIAVGGGKMIAAQYLSDGSYQIHIGFRLPEDWRTTSNLLEDASKLRQWIVRDILCDWAKVNTDLVEHSQGSFRLWPMYNMPVESFPWLCIPGVTLVGDAAHVTVPSGEGVNNAMFDSMKLGQRIAHHGTAQLAKAVAEYEEGLFERAVDHIKEAQKTSAMLFADNAPTTWLEGMQEEEG